LGEANLPFPGKPIHVWGVGALQRRLAAEFRHGFVGHAIS
jgi:hypothetical protein